jgi:subfamily B ATP-binding cassette protein MsbA
MVIYAAATAAYLYVIQIVIDGATTGADIGSYTKLVLPVALGVPLISAVTNYLQRLATNSVALNAVADMQTDMFDAVLDADLATATREPSGSLISRFVSDVTVVSGALIRIIGNLVRDVLTVIFVIVGMLLQSWQLSLAMLIFILALAPLIALSKKMRGSATQAQAHIGRITSELKESFDSARLVRAYQLEERERARLGESFATRIRLFLKLVSQQARVDPILEVLGGIAIAGVIIFGIWLLNAGTITPGQIGGVLTGVLILAPRLRALGTMNNVIQEMRASLSRIFAIADWQSTVTDRDSAIDMGVAKGDVSFEDVHVAYPDGSQALKGITLSIAPGERVALVGPSGGGKTTLLNLVPRLMDPSFGTVKLDGNDLRDLSLASVRRNIALVSQSVTLFRASVAENIGMGDPDASREQIQSAAKSADAHDFIMALPQGYDTILGEDGDTLSGGQRQRLSIARALLRDAPILLLDEATSALDAQSEAKVQAALERLCQGRTTLVIAHRLSTIKGADRIAVLDQGRLVEIGTEAELKASGGLFARLKSLQKDN